MPRRAVTVSHYHGPDTGYSERISDLTSLLTVFIFGMSLMEERLVRCQRGHTVQRSALRQAWGPKTPNCLCTERHWSSIRNENAWIIKCALLNSHLSELSDPVWRSVVQWVTTWLATQRSSSVTRPGLWVAPACRALGYKTSRANALACTKCSIEKFETQLAFANLMQNTILNVFAKHNLKILFYRLHRLVLSQ